MDWKEELEKAEKALGNEKNVIQITFYEGYIKGLKFLGNSQQQLLERLGKIQFRHDFDGGTYGILSTVDEASVVGFEAGFNSCLKQVKALIQEEKAKL